MRSSRGKGLAGGGGGSGRRAFLFAGAALITVTLVFILFGWPLLLSTSTGGLEGGRHTVDESSADSEQNVYKGSSISLQEGEFGEKTPTAHDATYNGQSAGSTKAVSLVPLAQPVHSAWSRQAFESKFGSMLHQSCRVCKHNEAYFQSRNTKEVIETMLLQGPWGTGESTASDSLLSNLITGSKQPFFCESAFKKSIEALEERDISDNHARFSFSPLVHKESRSAVNSHELTDLPSSVPLVLCAIGQRFEGPGGQSYVLEAIRQWRLFHSPSRSPIHLVLDSEIAKLSSVQTALGGELAAGSIRLHDPKSLLTQDWRRYFKTFYIQGYMHPGGSRQTGNQHFNQHVSERFFAIEAVMRKEGLKHVIHMENDIMIYDNLLPIVRASAACGYEMATTVIHQKGVIPSVLYIRNADSMKHFNLYLNEFLSCGLSFGKVIQTGYANDMTYLMNYYQLFGSQRLGMLPSWKHAKGENCVWEYLTAAVNDGAEGAESVVASAAVFPTEALPSSLRGPVLFDVASFGQWYSFSVARNRTRPAQNIRDAMRGRYLDATPPKSLTWEFYSEVGARPDKSSSNRREKSGEGLLVPRWSGYRLISLHIHAKNLAKFRSAGDSHYARRAVESGGSGELGEVFK